VFVTRRERWVAPPEDGGILIDPPPERVAELIETNRKRLDGARFQILGRSLKEIRQDLQESRAAVADASKFAISPGGKKWPVGPVIAAGHQPELYHPGVWIKNFAINGLARRFGLAPLNLVVDSDTVKSASIHLPVWNNNPTEVRREAIAFDQSPREEIYLTRPVHDPARFRSVPSLVDPITRNWPFRPILDETWREMMRVVDDVRRTSLAKSGEEESPTLMWLLTAARQHLEWRWGCNNRELFLISLDRRPFIAQILMDLPQFHEMYNECVAAYRRKYKLRSESHPVPDLVIDGEFLEAPFWWYDSATGERQRLFAAQQGDHFLLRPGAQGEAIAVARRDLKSFRELAQRGISLYTRALTTTMFIRLCIADLFVHGIGGAKYDEVTDNIIRCYFGIEPPEYMVVSGTLHLPFPRFPATKEDQRRLHRRIRDLHWHPEQFVESPDAEVSDWCKRKCDWLERQPQSPAEKRERYRALLSLTELLRPAVATREAEAERQLKESDEELAANEVLFRRDYSFVLYPEEKLKAFCTRMLNI
jgi:hypothetical protein